MLIINKRVEKLYGRKEAIVLDLLINWNSFTVYNDTKVINSKKWLCLTVKDISNIFYMKESAVSDALKNLEKAKLIQVEKAEDASLFNPKNWYLVTEKAMSYFQKEIVYHKI